VKEITDKVTDVYQKGRYFVVMDGTGAGHSYLGLFDARTGEYEKLAGSAAGWRLGSKSLVFCEILEGNPLSREAYKISVRRYRYLTKKKSTLVEEMDVMRMMGVSGKYIEYEGLGGAVVKRMF